MNRVMPDDFVLATGETHTIKQFIDECLKYLPDNKKYGWRLDSKGRETLVDSSKNSLVIGIDEKYFRPAEVDVLIGDYAKAKNELGWTPTVSFEELAERMMLNDLNCRQ